MFLIFFTMEKLIIRISLTCILIIWMTGILISFLPIPAKIMNYLFPMLKLCYSHICHQYPPKSFHWDNVYLLVCARCAGIYSGALITSLFSLILSFKNLPPNRALLFSVVPMLIDVIAYNAGLYEYSKIIAFSTGVLSGSVCFLYIMNAFENIFMKIFKGIN